MYVLHKTIHPPTTIDNCLYSYFYSKKRKDLIVSCKNILKIYRLVADDSQVDSTSNIQLDQSIYGSSETPADEAKSSKAKLECLQTFKLHGQLVAIEAISFPGSFRDSIILAFSSGKLSIVEYDPTTHDLKTISLHYFEDEDMKDGRTQFASAPLLRIDPEGRCAAFLIYDRNIVIIPFRKEALVATADGESDANRSSVIIKSPVMSSYKLNLTDELYVGEKIHNILDIQFLESYNEPTLLILHEPIKTWSGRLAVRQDTCSMVALSLNIEQKVHPIIWSMGDLPYDCYKAVAVPKPVGGVLIIAVNSLSYLNQSVPPYAVSLNGFNVNNTAFPLISQKGVKLSLDACRTCFISNDKLLVVTKSGDIYVLTLFNDGMRSIRQFHFQKAASSVIASCVAACDDRYVFLGSRLGNSLLLRYTEGPYEEPKEDEKRRDSITNGSTEPQIDDDNQVDGESDEPSEKKAKVDNDDNDDLTDWMAKDIKLIAEDDLEVYGETHDESENLPTVFSFQVCDSIANIGPCSRVSVGEPAFMLPEEYVNTRAPQIELVSNSGWGKSGALSLLQRTIRPQIVLSQKIDDCLDMWTVYGPSNQLDEVDYNTVHHSYLIISENDSTTVCEAGTEIKELSQSGFSYQTRTILAGNLGNNQFIVQVTPTGVKLLNETEQIHYLPMEVGSTIDSASLSDPYVILLSKNGIISQVVLKDNRLVLFKPKLASGKTKILTACIYKDVSGLFTTQTVDDTETSVNTTSATTQVRVEGTPATNTADISSSSITIDDEDELLYGETTVEDVVNFTTPSLSTNKVNNQDRVKEEEEVECKIKPVVRASATYWLFVGRDNGTLEVYSVPDYSLVYYVKNFPMMPKVLVDSGADSASSTSTSSSTDQSLSLPVLEEILVIGMGIKETRPILFARFNEQLVLFEAFRFHETQVTDHLKVRFKKLDETLILKPINIDDNHDAQVSDEPFKEKLCNKKVWLKSFTDISGYAGVFICGIVPSFFLMSQRGVIRRHEMTIDGVVVAFSSFHNVNCSKGFVYVNQHNDLRISLLPTQVTYDSSWPLRRIPLKTTVHHVKYHCESRCYILVTSVTENFNKIVRVAGDEKDYDLLERDDRTYIWPTYEKFSIELFSPVSWDAIAGTRMDFEEWEHVTALTNVSLASEGTKSGLKGYIAVGTNYCYGEDVTNRGRIWILDVIDVVPEPGLPLTRNKIKTIYCKEQKGPVTALCQVKGFLLSAIGQKIYIWQLEGDVLTGIAFIDTQIYIQSAHSIKSLIIVSDVYKSISLLRYQEETKTLALVSRDTKSFESYGCQYLIDHNQLAFVVFDVDGNVIVYSYSPEMRESHGGTRLIRKTEFHLGSQIIDSFRVKCVPLAIQGSTEVRSSDLRQLTVYAALDGSLGYFLPTTEKTYRRLQMLQNIMTSHLPHLAGLNPKAYRLLKTQKKSLMPPNSRVILDGDLLFTFYNLSVSQMYEIARKIGTTSSQVTFII